ncbi:MAG: geranyl-CoA carboxylase alpha subunit [Dinoroseobacter sp.]|jgi:geranyl-CoA carboxylase alpha subunit
MNHTFTSILIANRGEIACRIIRSAKSLGYHTVAVYSDADANSLHTQMADDAVYIGASPVQQSYLRADQIIKAAKTSGAQAVHPGYGFLSENAEFAEACQAAGLVFIGPSALAIRVMGNKAEAKRRMFAAGVPCVPGYEGESQEQEVLIAEAQKIGAPLMVKAAAGGGGRGMRLVTNLADLPNAILLARSEAQNAFGSSELILEKAIIGPRHVEVQVFADRQGNTIHLGERDCSVQRRHQKVVEEAPCPVMTESLRAQMGKAAVAAAKSINYEGAGTVEFLLDAQQQFYFLEMNTRLQVEHPVTELITGLDLVELQIQVAQGRPLGLTQDDVNLTGHAIEVRLYSEDPAQDFLPSSGLIESWIPAAGEGVRIDHGIRSGQEVSPYYDSMVAKVIAHGPDREVARMRLIRALKDTVFNGLKNNKTFLINCLEKSAFIEGSATTAFIQQHFSEQEMAEPVASFEQAAMAAVLSYTQAYQKAMASSVKVSPNLQNWSSAGALQAYSEYVFDEVNYRLCVSPRGSHLYEVTSSEEQKLVIEIENLSDTAARLKVDGGRQELKFTIEYNTITILHNGRSVRFVDQIQQAGIVEEGFEGGRIAAPMHGLVLELKVACGQRVSKGQSLLVLEAMKMQHEILASMDGEVVDLFVATGSQVSTDQALLEIAEVD